MIAARYELRSVLEVTRYAGLIVDQWSKTSVTQ